jgi:hypothetical protein
VTPAGAALLVMTFVLAAGCAVGPRYHTPEAPANAGYAPAPLPSSTAAAEVHGGEEQRLISARDIPFEWWQLFQSPALNALVERAFRANPTIAAAQAALVQAQELVYAQRGFFFPTINANYDFERQKIPGNLAVESVPGVEGNGDNLTPPVQSLTTSPHTAPLIYNFQTAQLTVGFVPDVFGANRRQVEALAAQRDAQRPTSRWPPTSSLPPSRKRRCVRRSRPPGRSSPRTRTRCRSCAISSGSASRCASTLRRRKQPWGRRGCRFRRCRSNSSRRAISFEC